MSIVNRRFLISELSRAILTFSILTVQPVFLLGHNCSTCQWRRQTRCVSCVQIPMHPPPPVTKMHNIFDVRFCIQTRMQRTMLIRLFTGAHTSRKYRLDTDNTPRTQYLENNCTCYSYLAIIANYHIVCCVAVRSAITARARLRTTTEVSIEEVRQVLTRSPVKSSALEYGPATNVHPT